MNFWLVKQEPTKYNWDQFVRDKGTYWDGVRNYQARNNLKLMKKGDLVLFYHSVQDKEIKGIARITGEHYPDPTTDDDRWVVVDLKPEKRLNEPVSLENIKQNPRLQNMPLIKQSRLSVIPVTQSEFKEILTMAKTQYSGV